MKKKALSALLATAMVATLLAGCGSTTAETAAPAATEEAAPAEEEAPAEEAAAEEARLAEQAARAEQQRSAEESVAAETQQVPEKSEPESRGRTKIIACAAIFALVLLAVLLLRYTTRSHRIED